MLATERSLIALHARFFSIRSCAYLASLPTIRSAAVVVAATSVSALLAEPALVPLLPISGGLDAGVVRLAAAALVLAGAQLGGTGGRQLLGDGGRSGSRWVLMAVEYELKRGRE
jgi:hypothetical protein